jgi:hypothetical protein
VSGGAIDAWSADGEREDAVRFSRVGVNVSPEVAQRLAWLKAKYGASATDVIAKAISALAYFERCRDDGGRILIEVDGDRREVVFL